MTILIKAQFWKILPIILVKRLWCRNLFLKLFMVINEFFIINGEVVDHCLSHFLRMGKLEGNLAVGGHGKCIH